MDFRNQLNSHVNTLPDEIRRDPIVGQYVAKIADCYERLFVWIGPNAIRMDINWNHIIQMIVGIRRIHRDDVFDYINSFQIINDENQNNYHYNHNNRGNNDQESEDSDDDNESSADDNESSDDDSESSDDDVEQHWMCAHCSEFTGSYDEVSAHETVCLHNREHNHLSVP